MLVPRSESERQIVAASDLDTVELWSSWDLSQCECLMEEKVFIQILKGSCHNRRSNPGDEDYLEQVST